MRVLCSVAIALVPALCACFTKPDPPLAPSGHDEDGDGRPDVRDNCPHVANPNQENGDGDEVGRACDPDPDGAHQQLGYFDAFASGEVPFTVVGVGSVTAGADTVDYDGAGYITLERATAVDDADVWIGVDIHGFKAGSTTHQISIRFLPAAGAPHIYTELYQDATVTKLGISYFDGTNYLTRSMKNLTMFPASDVTFHVALRQSAHQVTVSLAGTTETVSASTPEYTGGGTLSIVIDNVVSSLRYVAVIETQP